MNISGQHDIPSVPLREEHATPGATRRLEGGMRVNGQGLHRPAGDTPVVTVVTVVRNGESFLEWTILSVLGQTYDEVEFIVIDGGSTDGTLDVVRRYDPKIDYWISEPDKGIYDAMNKGIDRAGGEWVLFLNAGDVFCDSEVLKSVVQDIPPDAEVVYGGHQEDYESGYRSIRTAGPISDLWKGMIFSHQAMLVKTSLIKRYKFNVASRIAADYEFIYSLYQQRRRFHRSQIVISRVLADGFSASRNLRLTLDQWRIARNYTDQPVMIDLYHLTKLAGVCIKNMLKKVMPRRVSAYLRSR